MATYGHEGGYAFNEDQRGGHTDPLPKQMFRLGQNVTVSAEGTDLESPHAGVLSAFLGGEDEREIWYRVRDIHGCEFEFPGSDLSPA